MLSHTDEAHSSWGLTSFVALFTDACWAAAAEVSPNEVECLCSLLGSDINMRVARKFTAYVDSKVSVSTNP